MTHLFTYGSLMFDPVWRSIVSRHYHFEPASLAGFERFAVKGEDYPVVKPAGEDALVEGVVYFDLIGRDLIALDKFEGIYYQRSKVTLNTTTNMPGDPLSAEVYLLRPRFYSLASAKPWNKDHFQKQGLGRFLRKYKGFHCPQH